MTHSNSYILVRITMPLFIIHFLTNFFFEAENLHMQSTMSFYALHTAHVAVCAFRYIINSILYYIFREVLYFALHYGSVIMFA